MSDIKIPIELKQAINDNKLIIFVGAGLSYNLVNINGQPLKGWGNLVEEILQNQKENGHDVDMLLPLVNRFDPIKVLDLIETDPNISKKDIYNFTKDYLDLEDTKNDYSLHKKLFKLSKKIITTNYDTAFERAIPQLRKRKAYKGKNYELTTHRDSDAALLFKLHGCFEDVDSMVLFPSNYKQLYNPSVTALDAEHSLLVLKNIIYNNSILFIGTGMGDFQINNLFKQINKLQDGFQTKHFIITNKPLDSSLQFLTPIPIKEHTEILPIIDHLIHLKKEALSQESEEVKALKNQIKEYEDRVKELESKTSDSTKDELLEEEALKYFTKGLKHQLSSKFEKAIKQYKKGVRLNPNQHNLYNNWGNALGGLAKTKQGEEAETLFQLAFEKYQKAIEIKPDYQIAFSNWGVNLGELAKTKQGEEAETLFQQAFEKYQKAIEIKPDYYVTFYNWGNGLVNLAETKKELEVEIFLKEAIEKYQKAIEINPNYNKAYDGYGNALGYLGNIKQDREAEKLYLESFEQFQKSISIDSNNYLPFYNWGVYLGNLAKTKQGQEAETLHNQAFEKYHKAIEIKPNDYEAFYNWGINLGNLAKTKQGQEAERLFQLAFEKYQNAIEITPDYHLAFNNWGTALGDLAKTKQGKEAETLYNQAFEKYQKAIDIKPDYHLAFNNWGTDLGNLAKTKQGKEAEKLFQQAFQKYQKAIEIKPDFHQAFYNWGINLAVLAKKEQGKKAETLLQQAFGKYQKSAELGGDVYNLACIYAIQNKKEEALHYLELTLKNQEQTKKFVFKDSDWKAYIEDTDFLAVIEKYPSS